jgi:AcrR family transcriptional regulator
MATVAPQLRADAERNRHRILAAAAEAIARDGVEARVESIAEAAGVGVGTLYRRFPTKSALVQAVLVDLVEQVLVDVASGAEDDDPRAALEGGLRALGRWCARNRGLLDALEPEVHGSCEVLQARAKLLGALEPVLARAQASGAVRQDVTVTDLLPLTSLLTKLSQPLREADPRVWERFLGVALDGLRAEGARALPGRPPARQRRGVDSMP